MLAIIMAISLLKSGAVTAAVAGGAEAPLTNFTIAQMTRLGIYSNYFNGDCSGNEGENYPCRPLGSNPSSTFCLGEGAGVVALQCSATPQPGTPLILGWGTASEVAETATGITPSGSAFRRAIEAALNRYRSDYPELEGRISLIIPHAPGTRRGDQAELVALQSCFGASLPPLVSGKWLTGHTFGASGLLAIDLASRLSRLDFAGWDKESKSGRRGEGLKESLSYFPYPVLFEQEGYLNCIEPCSELCGTNFVTLINSNGFGGVACSLIIGW
jgi:3-oxoacyl-(acyl-carrier-protein) synthase